MPEQGRVITYSDAGVEALREEMRRDDTIVYIGQGIGPRGGNFQQTKGLWKEFGDDRLRDTGICELGATGVAIGAAMAGTRTVVDEVFLDFALEAITQIIQQAANISYMSNGKIKAPVLVRGAMGAVRNAGAHHSHTFYNWFANTPGLKVALPCTPYDVKGLFKTALREPGPVIFIEHKSLYNSKGAVPEEEYLIPFGEARIVREGKDLTIIAMSRMVNLASKAAGVLAEQGISAEVIDPRTRVTGRKQPSRNARSVRSRDRHVVTSRRDFTRHGKQDLLRAPGNVLRQRQQRISNVKDLQARTHALRRSALTCECRKSAKLAQISAPLMGHPQAS